MTEEWRPLPDFRGVYEVSNKGGIRRILKNGKTRKLNPYLTKRGYMRVPLCIDGKTTNHHVHRCHVCSKDAN